MSFPCIYTWFCISLCVSLLSNTSIRAHPHVASTAAAAAAQQLFFLTFFMRARDLISQFDTQRMHRLSFSLSLSRASFPRFSYDAVFQRCSSVLTDPAPVIRKSRALCLSVKQYIHREGTSGLLQLSNCYTSGTRAVSLLSAIWQ